MNRRLSILTVAAFAVATAACDLDLQDPNIPTEEAVISNPVTLAQTVVGLQAEYAGQLADPITTVAMVTNELGAGPATFESYRVVDTGSQAATNDFGFSTGTWSGQYRVIRIADVVINNAGNVGFGPGTVSGILAMGKFFKAAAFGNLINVYERVPLQVGPNVTDPQFATRDAVIDYVITLLEEAEAHLVATPASSEFNAQIKAPGFDLLNTIRAYLARYHLIAGNLAEADAAAASVNLTVFSEFRFSTSDANPVWNLASNGGNSTAMRPEDRFRLDAEAGDERVEFWVTAADIPGWAGNLDDFDRYSARTDAIPAYLPDEMRLIRAEVAARQNNLPAALIFVNQVRTQCDDDTPHPEPTACLPPLLLADVPTQGAMLDEILLQRRYELYLQGVRWEDLRRFGEVVKYEFMPVPITECDRNPNTPPELCTPQPANPAGAS